MNSKIKDIQISNTEEITKNKNSLSAEEITPNIEVYVSNFHQNGIVLSHITKSNEVQVQIGNIKTNVNIQYLEKIANTAPNKVQSNLNSNYTKISKTKNVKSEINVIGLNVEEATFVIDKFLDDCSLAKLQTARIVHGKGTGKLRNGIHQFLKKNPHIKSFRLGTYGEGEIGVTIVELK